MALADSKRGRLDPALLEGNESLMALQPA